MGNIKSYIAGVGIGIGILACASYAEDEIEQDVPIEMIEDVDVIEKNLTQYDQELNHELKAHPPVFMRIIARSPSIDHHFHQVTVKLIDAQQYPCPYRASHPGLTFLGFSTPEAKLGIFLDDTLIHTYPFEGVKNYTFCVPNKDRGVEYQGSLEVFEDELKTEVRGYTAGDRYFDPKNIHEGINELDDDVHVVERHYGPNKVYKLHLSLTVD